MKCLRERIRGVGKDAGPQIELSMATDRSDVLFVFPPATGNAGAFKNHLGAAYILAALAKDGMATAQYLNPNPGTIDSVAADILRRKSPLVGFTVFDSNARLSVALAQSIKRRRPETQIVFGGPTATFILERVEHRWVQAGQPIEDWCVCPQVARSEPETRPTDPSPLARAQKCLLRCLERQVR